MSPSGRNQRNCNEHGNQLSHENQSLLDLSPWIIVAIIDLLALAI